MPRKTAYKILCDVLINDAYASLAIKKVNNLSPEDMSLATQIIYGTLRNYDLCTYQWVKYTKTKVVKRNEILLNMAMFQLYFLDKLPTYAIVNESVNLADGNYRSLINAILRKCCDQPLQLAQDDTLESLAINTSIPLWLVKMFNAHYGSENCYKICHCFTKSKDIISRINPLKINMEDIIGDELVEKIDEYAFIYRGNIVRSKYYEQGLATIQNYSSQMAVKLLDPKPFETVLDACSAPGSKTSFIAGLMNNTGKLIACDLYEKRLELVKSSNERLNVLNCELKVMDATCADTILHDMQFDKILLDVPCSGLGALSKKADIKFKVTPESIDEICIIQNDILNSCKHLIKTGGTIVYSTCTLNKKENEKMVAKFIKENEDFELVFEQTFFPFEQYCDGFYVAKLVKK